MVVCSVVVILYGPVDVKLFIIYGYGSDFQVKDIIKKKLENLIMDK